MGHIVASIDERAIGPFLAKQPEGSGLAAWITAGEGSGRRVVVMPLAANGEPSGPEKSVGTATIDTTMVVVRTMRGTAPGFVIAWTSLTERGESLWSISVGLDGTPRGKAVELARTSEDVVWVDVIPTDAGAVCLWAEEVHGGEANIVAAALDTDGKVRGLPARVARNVTGWHVLELPGGVGISTVTAAATPVAEKKKDAKFGTADAARGGALSFHRLDAEGHPSGGVVSIADKPTVSGDVEVVRAGSRLVFAWTDRTTEEPFVATAALDEHGVVAPPRKVVEARGGAALLGLAAGPHDPALMWEAPASRIGDVRHVRVARVGQHLGPEGRPLTFDTIGRSTPELAAMGSGFAVLATMRDCERDSSCTDAPILPTMLRTDERVAAVQRETLTFGSDPASLAWDMACGKDMCLALAASGAGPSRIRTAELRPRVNLKVEPPVPTPVVVEGGPRIEDLTAVVSGESVVDLAAIRVGASTMLVTLSAPAGRTERPRADESERGHGLTLATRMVDANGVASSPIVISTRALAVGGVAIAAAEKAEDGAALAWVARENGDPEVHVTRVDKRGKRTNDVQLTTAKGDASDVAIVTGGGGFIVAWVDGRNGNGEVYATKVMPDLKRVAREERITNAPGDATDLVALARGENVWLAWADSRESPKDGMADIFMSAIRMHDAKRAIDEQRVLGTAAHSRTPQLVPAGDGAHLAWIEEAPMGMDSPSASGFGAMLATLDANVKLLKKPLKIPFGGEGAPTSVTLDVSGPVLRAIVARSTADAIALDAVDLSTPGGKAFPLLMLDGPPSLDVALVMDGDMVYFNDAGPNVADKRARRARIVWPR
ncbi:hypothetical protein AKJ09_02575 [Labilithrix luteola]|uniref:Uncharacterized protein n=1 Tax=Labilithrix luteola TaxID=1391654 RepID=A0A0K1PRA7_9BACT|nr:hypothetical protein AKJ09_02575 [Labilithrix luteola]